MSADNSKLKRRQKGESGNPSGRPKLRLNEIAKAHADSTDADDPAKRCPIVVVFDELYSTAVMIHSGRAAEEYLSRVLGKPVTPLDVLHCD